MAERDPRGLLLAVPEISDLMAAVFKDFVVMKGAALTLSNQPELDLALVPSLGMTQGLIKGDIDKYDTTYAKTQIGFYEQVKSLNNLVRSFFPEFQSLLGELEKNSGDAAQVNQFVLGLQIFRDRIRSFKQNAERQRRDMQFLQNNVHRDQIRYMYNRHEIEQKITGNSGDIATLKDKIQEITKKLDEVNDRIAEGASRDALKAVEFGLKAGAAVVGLPGVGSLVMDTSFELLNKAVDDGRDPLAESDALLRDYSSAMLKINHETNQSTVLTALIVNGDRFIRRVDDAVQTLDRIADAFDHMANGVSLLAIYSVKSEPSVYQKQLSQAKEFWAEVADQATKYDQLIQKIDWTQKEKKYG